MQTELLTEAIPMLTPVESDRMGPVCGLPELQDYYGDGYALYYERCPEPICWDNQDGSTIWCLAGHERQLAE